MIRPWTLAHRGVVDVVGVVFWPDGDASRARVLAMWRPGMHVYALHDAWALTLGAPRRLRAERMPGAALVELAVDGGALRSSSPLSLRERAALVAGGARPGDLVVTRGGVAETVSPARVAEVDPSTWIDLGDVDPVAVRSLGREPPPVELVQPGPPPPRKVVGASLADALSQALAARGVDASALTPPTERGGVLVGLLGAVAGLFAAGRSQHEPSPAKPGAPGAAGLSVVSGADSAGWLARARRWLASRFARSMANTRLAEMLGRRQAEYLQRTIEMFRRGDLDEALRHAIRLGGDGAVTPGATPRAALALPSPRSGLTVDLRPSSTVVGSASTSYEETLRELYRAALADLEAQGRIDEAAFVQAELLRDAAGAVSLLERHQRYGAAATLAEAIPLSPELRARLWVLAGDLDRALLLVRQFGCYAAALSALSATSSGRDVLVRAWARHLAHTGDLVGAVTVAQGDASLRDEVAAWRAAVIAVGGAAGIAMRVQRVVADPESFAVDREPLAALCEARGERATRDRAVLADAITKAPALECLREVARMAVRPMIHDAARSGELQAREQVHAMLQRVGDPLLQTDVRAWPMFSRTPLASRAKPVEIVFDDDDRGVTPVHDAVWNDGAGLLAAALGEGGLAVLRHDDDVPRRVDQPAHQLVAGPTTLRALALAPRGEALQVARVDLGATTAESWSEVRLDAWSDTWDGDTWVVFQGEALLPVDGVASSVRALREHRPERMVTRVRSTRGLAVSHGAAMCSTLLELRDADARWLELWRHELPSWHLRERRQLAHSGACEVGADGVVLHAISGNTLRVELEGRSLPLPLPAAMCEGRSLRVARPWLAVATQAPDHALVSLLTVPDMMLRATVTLRGSRRVNLRLSPDWLVIADDRGRVEVLDLHRGVTRRSLRV